MVWKQLLTLGGLCVLGVAGGVRADTITTKDGKTFNGIVTVDGDTYTIKNKFGDFTVSAENLGEWKKEDAAVPGAQGTRPAESVAPASSGPAGKLPVQAIATQPAERSPLQIQAEEAMAAGNYKGAIDLLLPVSKDSHDVRLLHALGLSYMETDQLPLAGYYLEKASKETDPPARAVLLNLAAFDLAAKLPGKAIKMLSDYLAKHPKDVDEQVLNALGRSLAAADDATRNLKYYNDAAMNYLACNATLEKTRPGFKRYGEDWYPAAEATAKLKALSDSMTSLNQARTQAWAADQRLAAAQNSAAHPAKNANVNALNSAVQTAQKSQQDAQQRVADALAKTKSPFSTTLDTVSLDSVRPGAAGAVAVVVAQPPAEPVQVAVKPPEHMVVEPPKIDPPKIDPPKGVKNEVPIKPPPPAIDPPRPPKPVEPVAQETVYAAAFPIGDQLFVTSAKVVKGASDISIEGRDGVAIKAKIERIDEASGLALIRVSEQRFTFLGLAENFAGGKFECPSYDTVDLFNPAAAMAAGTAPEPAEHWTLTFEHRPKLPGSPLIVGGTVVGVELGGTDAEPDKADGVTLEKLKKFIGDDKPNAPSTNPDPAMSVYKVNVNKV